MSDEHLRMSDAEREQATAELGEHYAQGRLSTEEHAERLDRIWSSRTRGELAPIFRDLPGAPYAPYAAAATPADPGPRRSGRGSRSPGGTATWRRGVPGPLLVVLAVLLVVMVVTHLPFLLIGLLVWVLVVARHRNRRYAHRW